MDIGDIFIYMHTLSSLSHRQQAILRHILHSDGGLTLDQLANLLEISRNAVTQHIAALEKLGCIETSMLPSAGGRPSRAYRLAEKGMAMFPKQYALISTALLNSVSEYLNDDELEKLFISIGHSLAASFKDRVKQSKNKIAEVIEIMEELGYEAMSSSTNMDTEIIAKNCVFHDLAVENSTVCELDRTLISELLGSRVEQQECMVKGGNSCRFCINKT